MFALGYVITLNSFACCFLSSCCHVFVYLTFSCLFQCDSGKLSACLQAKSTAITAPEWLEKKLKSNRQSKMPPYDVLWQHIRIYSLGLQQRPAVKIHSLGCCLALEAQNDKPMWKCPAQLVLLERREFSYVTQTHLDSITNTSFSYGNPGLWDSFSGLMVSHFFLLRCRCYTNLIELNKFWINQQELYT